VRNLAKKFRRVKRMNWFMTLAIFLLVIIGELFIRSSSFTPGSGVDPGFWQRQIRWIVLGSVCYVGLAMSNYRDLRRVAVWGYGLCMILLILVLIIGEVRYGARRWLAPFGAVGPSIQPSELMKLALVIFIARVLSLPWAEYERFKQLCVLLALVAAPFALIVLQPDLGTAMVFVPVTFIMMFVGGVPLRYLGVILGIGVTLVLIVLAVLILPPKLGMSEETHVAAMENMGLHEHQVKRLMVYLGLEKDPLGSEWNKRQSMIAVGSGGIWGKGYQKGYQNILGFVPKSVTPTDFIYSVIAEEKGFMGSLTVLFLFGVIVVGGSFAAFMARDKFGRLLCVGIVSLLFCHVFINIAMTIGLMPITGLPLPLLSYGGTFMLVMMSSLGIVQSVYIRSRGEEFIDKTQ
jgi:rod shape determining protein RodA